MGTAAYTSSNTSISLPKLINPPIPIPFRPKPKSLDFLYTASTTTTTLKLTSAALKKNDFSDLITRKGQSPNPRRLIKLSTSEGKWQLGSWNSEYVFSLRDLQLQDLVQGDDDKEVLVSIYLCVQKHAGFGLSVDGKIVSSFTAKCGICSSLYLRRIDAKFNVWVLPSSRRSNDPTQLPDIGGDDPSVIYVKPGCEADLDSLIHDTIRLTTSVNETCSESCERSEPKLHHISKQNVASLDKRWSRLLELKKAFR